MAMAKQGNGRWAWSWLLLAAAGGCLGPDAEGRVDRHVSFPVWTGAIERQFEVPEQYVPEAFLLAGTIAGRPASGSAGTTRRGWKCWSSRS
jgi:hypothetical protein